MMAVGVGIHHQLQHQAVHGKTTPQGALRGLVQAGLIEQHGASRWTYYRLKVPRELPEQKVPQADEDKILAYVRKHGTINNTQCRELSGVGVFSLLEPHSEKALPSPSRKVDNLSHF
jgi:hypothetical protein